MIKVEDLEIGDILVEKFRDTITNWTILYLNTKLNLITVNVNNQNIDAKITEVLEILNHYNTTTLIKKNKQIKDDCIHEYKSYIGFTQTYNYCTKCDQKQT